MNKRKIMIERKPIMYGLATLLSNNTGRNITCCCYETEKYSVNSNDVWSCDLNVVYELKEDNNKIISLKDVNKSTKGIDFLVEYKRCDLDKYMSYEMAKLLFYSMSLRYDTDIMYVLDEITQCDKRLGRYIEKQEIENVFKNNYSKKQVLVK